MKLVVCKNYDEVSAKAAEYFINLVKAKPNAVLGLATGSSPIGMYKLMIADHEQNGTSYKDVKTYNLDEYVGLDGSNNQSYHYFMNENLFKGLDIPLENTHVPSGIGNHDTLAAEYDAVLDELGGADLQILGIGSNGHIAFNEPGTSFASTTHIVDLTEETIQDNARFFDSIDDVPRESVTMGIASIMKAKKIVLIATSAHKAEAIKGMIEGPVTEDLPASILQQHPDVVVIVDTEAASLLDK
ncbi:glucosamine-6-phosphate deaminase [Culicoidibacter larvae]|uniref:Glucosamine-6-phosphate deaminase n=1 Tax=Culicoidibacter larvae TaxID=2579976 RepID=A0A5R8QBR1_9FIRM|nr:glucosamine-6-phosphate deaminase [Culicoidibacter larvae]